MSNIKTYRDLLIWQKSKELTVMIYRQTQSFPKAEEFGLKSQMRRSAVSVPSNIAEGFGRYSAKEFRRFLRIAIGSLYELQTQQIVSFELNYLKKEKYDILVTKCLELEKMMNSFINKISRNIQ